jgi:molybdopterin converting factor small subunit
MTGTTTPAPSTSTTRATPADPGSGSPGSRAEAVTFRLFASARAVAGTAEVRIAPGPTTQVLAALGAGLPPRFADVLAVSSLLADGTHVDRSSSAPLPAGTVVDVLPPFAGG